MNKKAHNESEAPENGEAVAVYTKACRLCNNDVYAEDWAILSPCCRSLFHFGCLYPHGMLWVKAGNSIICPRCTDPRRADPDALRRLRVKLWKEADERGASDTAEAVGKAFKAFQYLNNGRSKMRATAVNDIKAMMACWPGNMDGIAFMKRHNLDFGKLLSMKWSVGMIHRYIAKTWTQLVDDLGFTPQSMIGMKNEQINDIIALYDMDVHLLRKEFGSISPGFTIKSLQDLRLDASILSNLKIDAHELACMGLDRNQLCMLRYIQLHDWKDELNLGLQHLVIWNIKTSKDIAHIDTWTIEQLAVLFDVNPARFRRLRVVKDTVVWDNAHGSLPGRRPRRQVDPSYDRTTRASNATPELMGLRRLADTSDEFTNDDLTTCASNATKGYTIGDAISSAKGSLGPSPPKGGMRPDAKPFVARSPPPSNGTPPPEVRTLYGRVMLPPRNPYGLWTARGVPSPTFGPNVGSPYFPRNHNGPQRARSRRYSAFPAKRGRGRSIVRQGKRSLPPIADGPMPTEAKEEDPPEADPRSSAPHKNGMVGETTPQTEPENSS